MKKKDPNRETMHTYVHEENTKKHVSPNLLLAHRDTFPDAILRLSAADLLFSNTWRISFVFKSYLMTRLLGIFSQFCLLYRSPQIRFSNSMRLKFYRSSGIKFLRLKNNENLSNSKNFSQVLKYTSQRMNTTPISASLKSLKYKFLTYWWKYLPNFFLTPYTYKLIDFNQF